MKPAKTELELGREHAARIEKASGGKDLSNVDVSVVWTQQYAYACKVRDALIKIGCRSVRLEQGGPWHSPETGVYVCSADDPSETTPPGARVLLGIFNKAGILDSNELDRYGYGQTGIVYVLVAKAG